MSLTRSHASQLPFFLLPTLILPCGSHAPRAGIPAAAPGKTRTVLTPSGTMSYCEPASKPLPCRPPTLPIWAHFQASQTLSYGWRVAIPLAATEVFPLGPLQPPCSTYSHVYVCGSVVFRVRGRVVQLHKHVFPIVDRWSLRPLPTPYLLLSVPLPSAHRKLYTDSLTVLST